MGGIGSGGHNRKSQDQHRRQGTFKKGKHGHLPPTAPNADAGRPDADGLTGAALEEFNRLLDSLAKLGTLTVADGPTVRLTAEATAALKAMREEHAELLAALKDSRELARTLGPRQRAKLLAQALTLGEEIAQLPALILRAQAQLHKQLEGLGLTHASRGKVRVAKKVKDDDEDTAEALGPLARLQRGIRRVK
jgi:hypothetical protein